jgi:tetratricopeptide (TPR) repeat protein
VFGAAFVMALIPAVVQAFVPARNLISGSLAAAADPGGAAAPLQANPAARGAGVAAAAPLTPAAGASAALPPLLPPARPRPLPHAGSLAGLIWLTLAPPGLAWLALATQRAWRDDPLRDRRRARRALERLIAGWQGRSPSRLDLETWRDGCVRAWGLRRAVPSAAELAADLPAEAQPAAWSALWAEAEQALFSNRRGLPPDWTERAAAAIATLPRLPIAPRLPLGSRAWWPALPRSPAARAAAALALPLSLVFGFALTANPLTAVEPGAVDDPAADYQAGRFAQARQCWLEQIARSPGDWTAHYNAALTLAREERWGSAAGHWTAAFLLNPSDPAVAAAFRLGLSKLDGADPVLHPLAAGSGFHRLATLGSVAQWQGGLRAGATALALGLTALLAFAYLAPPTRLAHEDRPHSLPAASARVRSPWPHRGAMGLAAGGALLLALSALALRQYGPLVEPRTAFVVSRADLRAIPSDIVAREATSALLSGTLVMVHRSYLGWDQVSVNGGVVGWVRTDTLLWLYLHRDAALAATIQPP